MNFLEAVKALNNGECEGIRHLNWTQKMTPQFLCKGKDGCFAWSGGFPFEGFLVSQCTTDDWELVAPVPQTEDVEIKRWAIYSENGDFKVSMRHDVKPDQTYIDDNWPGCHLVELSGMLPVEVKPKVKHREIIHYELGGEFVADNNRWRPISDLPKTAMKYAEWEE